MFRPYRGGEKAPRGTYWNPYTGQFLEFEKEASLPGSKGVFFRVSLPVLVLLGPFLGLFFLIFVPLTVPIVVAAWAAQRVRATFSPARAATPPRPARAH